MGMFFGLATFIRNSGSGPYVTQPSLCAPPNLLMSFSASWLWETMARLQRLLGNNASFDMILGCRCVSRDEPVFICLGSLGQWFWSLRRASEQKAFNAKIVRKTPFFGLNSGARPFCGTYQCDCHGFSWFQSLARCIFETIALAFGSCTEELQHRFIA